MSAHKDNLVFGTQEHLTFLCASAAKPDFVALLFAIVVLNTPSKIRPS